MGALRKSPFVVYAKPPFGGPERVLAYLARYTHRTAIANSRLVAVDDDEVAFSYKDYRRSGRSRVMRLAPHEFIRRFLLHVLPDGFHRIRHSGFLAKGDRGENLARVRELLDVQQTHPPGDKDQASTTSEPDADADAHAPLPVCPDCGGFMRRIGLVAPNNPAPFAATRHDQRRRPDLARLYRPMPQSHHCAGCGSTLRPTRLASLRPRAPPRRRR